MTTLLLRSFDHVVIGLRANISLQQQQQQQQQASFIAA
jgi:hypothetical protein